MTWFVWHAIRAVCRLSARRIDLRVEGLEHLPERGPVVLAARHYHHFWDGCALVATLPRPIHLVVALDWVENPIGKRVMTAACRAAAWPVVARPDHPRHSQAPAESDAALMRVAARESVDLLRARRALLVFPEGYPNLDPGYTPKTGDTDVLPFRPGFLRFVALAQRAGIGPVPIVPVGLEYQRGERWHLTIRFGTPVTPGAEDHRGDLLRHIEAEVRRLSGLPSAPLDAGCQRPEPHDPVAHALLNGNS